MCGIAGWLGLGLAPEERAPRLRAMCAALRHRGPDDAGFFADEHVGLGMQRLSIVDLAGGHQPMASDDGAIQLAFNGEIYDHARLRDELARQGHRFRTRSDTEVILRGYEEWGLAAFERMNGMFAVAIWDGRERRLHLVRDRLGVKPLVYYFAGRALVFASEAKALLASGAVPKRLREQALWDYLTFRYVPGPEAIWEDVYHLPPGHRLSLGLFDDAPRVERWWDAPFGGPRPPRDDATLDAEFASLFEDAVNLRMLADVPVGVLLSGGLDSSAVAAAVARAPGARLATFSVAFAGAPELDERPFARQVAAHLGTDHHEVVIGERDVVDFLPELVWHSDEPLADLASVPLYHVSKLARGFVKVVLSGEGSDEVLGGYDFDVLAAAWARAARARATLAGRMPRAGRLPRAVAALAGRALPSWRSALEAAELETDERRLPVPHHMTNYLSSAEKRALLASRPELPDSLDRLRADLARLGAAEPLHQLLYVYCQSWLAADLLAKADRMSMACSLELRTPFLDWRLVEWSARAPARAKVGPDERGHLVTKWVLRRWARAHLPASIVERPKRGFPVPVYEWLAGPLRGFALDHLLGRDARAGAWLEAGALRGAVERGLAASATTLERHRVANLLVLELWMRRWL